MYTSCRFQSNLQVLSLLAKAVTADDGVATNYRMLHTLNRCTPFKVPIESSLINIYNAKFFEP